MTNTSPNTRLEFISKNLGNGVESKSIWPLCSAWMLCGIIRIKPDADASLILSESSKIVWC